MQKIKLIELVCAERLLFGIVLFTPMTGRWLEPPLTKACWELLLQLTALFYVLFNGVHAKNKELIETNMTVSFDEMQGLYYVFHATVFRRYTHKTSDFRTSGFKTSGFKMSETSGLQNVKLTKCQLYKTSGLQTSSCKKNFHIYYVLVVGGNPQVLLQPDFL